jgi:polysaccharide biosynthesis protein PelC
MAKFRRPSLIMLRMGEAPRVKMAHSVLAAVLMTLLTSCSGITSSTYRDPNMDFSAIQTVGVMPFQNLSRENLAADRVRNVFMNRLLSTGTLYVVPVGEIARVVNQMEMQVPATPSPAEVVKLAGTLKTEAIITGVVQEYGEVRSGSSTANLITVSVHMLEAQTGRIVWSASSTKGGIGITDRLFGGGGQPMYDVTRNAVDDLIDKLFK